MNNKAREGVRQVIHKALMKYRNQLQSRFPAIRRCRQNAQVTDVPVRLHTGVHQTRTDHFSQVRPQLHKPMPHHRGLLQEQDPRRGVQPGDPYPNLCFQGNGGDAAGELNPKDTLCYAGQRPVQPLRRRPPARQSPDVLQVNRTVADTHLSKRLALEQHP